MAESKKNLNKTFSMKIFISFAQGTMIYAVVDTAIFSTTQYFFENEIQLNVWLYTLAFTLYTLWNMFNDPFLGYICDRTTRFTKKWGKRFIWILIGVFPYCFVPIFIFSAPTVAQSSELIVFVWTLVSLCALDTCLTLYQINYSSLLPDKFRSENERQKVGSVSSIIATIGIFVAYAIPPLTAEYGNLPSYLIMAIVITIIGLISAIAFIPGIREDQEMRERRAKLDQEERVSFFKTLVKAIRQKNFMALVFITLCWDISIILIQSSLSFYNAWILGLTKDNELYPSLAYMILGVVSVPVWYKIAVKKGSLKVFYLAYLIFGIGVMLFIFVSDLILTLVLFGVGGFAMGGATVVGTVLGSDVIDEAAVITGKRQEGIYNGIRIFIIRLSFIAQVVLFAVVHTLTNYVPGNPGEVVQPPEALFGIRLLLGVIPGLVILFGLLVFWKVYDLTPTKSAQLKEKLKEMNL